MAEGKSGAALQVLGTARGTKRRLNFPQKRKSTAAMATQSCFAWRRCRGGVEFVLSCGRISQINTPLAAPVKRIRFLQKSTRLEYRSGIGPL
jgi:hypothetical protein